MKQLATLVTSLAITSALAGEIAQAQPATTLQYPVAPKSEQVDTYFGTTVADPYRWLENTDSSETKAWVAAENKVTTDYLSQIPFRNKIKERLEKIWNFPKYSQPSKVGEYYFFYKNDGLQNQSTLYVQKGLKGEPRVFIDPNTLSTDGTVALGEVSYSYDNKYAAYTLQSSGSDWLEIHVRDIATGKDRSDVIKWAKFTDIAWFHDGFFYSGYDAPKDAAFRNKNENQKAFYHKLGTDQSEDKLIYEDNAHPERLVFVGTTQDQKYIFLQVSDGSQKGATLSYQEATDGSWTNTSTAWHPLVTEFGTENGVIETDGDLLYLVTNKLAPKKKVVQIDLRNPEVSGWKTVIPERSETLEDVNYVGGKFIVTCLKDASTHAFVYSKEGKELKEITFPTFGTASGFNGRKNDQTVFYSFSSFTSPRTVYQYDVEKNTSSVFRKADLPFSIDNFEAKQVFYPSKDGTKVPMFIVHKKGIKMDGTNPTYLTAYGGFNVNMTPYFSIANMIILENGGILAIPNLRGGGEYGEQWHEAGMKLHKQNVFDDFIAAAEYLFKEKYTSPARLAIEGGSNGGLLIGAVLNQRPDICKVAFPQVGVMDMLRFHKFTIGWHWVSEYGSSDDPIDFKNLLGYSPLHNIRATNNYPAVMVTTADHDDRVVPGHSFKYTATLQDTYKGNNPVLIRIETKAGHGGGKPTAKTIEELSDMYAFMFYNMNITPSY